MAAKYVKNSKHKDFIRKRWVAFIQELVKEDGSLDESGIGLITFPSDEMNDLEVFAENGFIGWEQGETESLNIIKGRVVCFEKSFPRWKKLRTKLSNAEVVQSEFEKYIGNNFKSFEKGSIKMFPVDVINLDYDGAISKNALPIDVTMSIVFNLQARFQKSFSLFMTWPRPFTPEKDEPDFIKSLQETIKENLVDPRAAAFKQGFELSFQDIEGIDYSYLSIIGLTKKILAQASAKRFQIKRQEYYSYGEPGKQCMMSVLYHFSYMGDAKTQSSIYSEDVSKALAKISVLT